MSRIINFADKLALPAKDSVTIGESNTTLINVSGPRDPKLASFIKKHGELYAALQMPSRNTSLPQRPIDQDQEHHGDLYDYLGDTAETPLIQVPQQLLDRIHILAKQWGLSNVENMARSTLRTVQELLDTITNGSDDQTFPLQRDRLAKLLIRAMAWHPHQPLLAIALWNDSVWVYDLSVEGWLSSGLSHPVQSTVMTLEWKPMSGVVLAIGCARGVALWHVFRGHGSGAGGVPTTTTTATTTGTSGAEKKARISSFGGKSVSQEQGGDEQQQQQEEEHPSEDLSRAYNLPSRSLNQGRDTAFVGFSRLKELEGLAVDQMAWDPRGEMLAMGSSFVGVSSSSVGPSATTATTRVSRSNCIHSSSVYIRDGATKQLVELKFWKPPTVAEVVQTAGWAVKVVGKVVYKVGRQISGGGGGGGGQKAEGSAGNKDQEQDGAEEEVDGAFVVNRVCSLVWSPRGDYLLVGYTCGVVRIWSVADWSQFLDITELEDRFGIDSSNASASTRKGPKALSSICWTPDGLNLVYALEGEDLVRAIHLSRVGSSFFSATSSSSSSLLLRDTSSMLSAVLPSVGSISTTVSQILTGTASDTAMALSSWIRLHSVRLTPPSSSTASSKFGPITQLALDPNGERLVIRYRDSDLVGVVMIKPTGDPLKDLDIFMPLGFLRGPLTTGDDAVVEKPTAVEFVKAFGGGAMLAVAWASGRVTFVPFYYVPQQAIDSM